MGLNNTVQVYFPEDDMTEQYKLVTIHPGQFPEGPYQHRIPHGKGADGTQGKRPGAHKVDDDYSYDVVIKSIENTIDDGSDAIRKF